VRLPVDVARLVRGVSDDFDTTDLSNALRGLVNSEVNFWTKPVTTINATLTAVWSDDMPANSVGDFTLSVVASVAGATSVAGYRRRAVFVRVGTGAVAYLGAGADIIGADKESVAGWDVSFALDAATPGTLYAAVTGAAATTITWRAHIKGAVSPWA
jgi:hypothetical protein